MKNFISTTTGKITALAVTVLIIAGCIAGVMLSDIGYRSIRVEDLNGSIFVTEGKKTEAAYKGQNLKSGDSVEVLAKSNLTLALDSDKFLYADEMTKFRLEAVGKDGEDSRTVIRLDDGCVLSRIDKKLGPGETYMIETPNSTMSVRGTIFGVEMVTGENGETYTVTNVYEGTVELALIDENGVATGETASVGAGQSIDVLSTEGTAPGFGDIKEIDYSAMSVEMAAFIIPQIDGGRITCVTKDEVNAVAGTSRVTAPWEAPAGTQVQGSSAANDEDAAENAADTSDTAAEADTPLTESEAADTADTAASDEISSADTTADSNNNSSNQKAVTAPVGPTAEEIALAQQMTLLAIMQQQAEAKAAEEAAAKAAAEQAVQNSWSDNTSYEPEQQQPQQHVHSFSAWPATCTQAGTKERSCACGYKEYASIPIQPHTQGSLVRTDPATCGTDEVKVYTCSVCQIQYDVTTPGTATGTHVANTAVSAGETHVCTGLITGGQSTTLTFTLSVDYCSNGCKTINNYHARMEDATNGIDYSTSLRIVPQPGSINGTRYECELCGTTLHTIDTSNVNHISGNQCAACNAIKDYYAGP